MPKIPKITTHCLTQLNDFSCDQCPYKSTNVTAMRLHYKVNHKMPAVKKEENFRKVCGKCGKKLFSNGACCKV